MFGGLGPGIQALGMSLLSNNGSLKGAAPAIQAAMSDARRRKDRETQLAQQNAQFEQRMALDQQKFAAQQDKAKTDLAYQKTQTEQENKRIGFLETEEARKVRKAEQSAKFVQGLTMAGANTFTQDRTIDPRVENAPSGNNPNKGQGRLGAEGELATNGRTVRTGPDGEQYTEKSMTFQNAEGKWVSLPSVDEQGNDIDPRELEQQAQSLGGGYNTAEEAVTMAQQRSGGLIPAVQGNVQSNSEDKRDRHVRTGDEGKPMALRLAGLPQGVRQGMQDNPFGAAEAMQPAMQEMFKEALTAPSKDKEWSPTKLVNFANDTGDVVAVDMNDPTARNRAQQLMSDGYAVTGQVPQTAAKAPDYKVWLRPDGKSDVFDMNDPAGQAKAKEAASKGARPDNVLTRRELTEKPNPFDVVIEEKEIEGFSKLQQDMKTLDAYETMAVQVLHPDLYTGTGGEALNKVILFAQDTLGLFKDIPTERLAANGIQKKELMGMLRKSIMGADQNFSNADRQFLGEAFPDGNLNAKTWGTLLAVKRVKVEHAQRRYDFIRGQMDDKGMSISNAKKIWDERISNEDDPLHKEIKSIYAPDRIALIAKKWSDRAATQPLYDRIVNRSQSGGNPRQPTSGWTPEKQNRLDELYRLKEQSNAPN